MKKFAEMLTIVAMITVLAAGCASTGKGASDEEIISKRIQEGIAALKAKNFNAFEGMISKEFSSNAVGDKEDLLAYLKNADDMGFLDELEVDMTESKITVDGSNVTVLPVVAEGSFGSLSLEFTGAKENGTWMVTGVEPGF